MSSYYLRQNTHLGESATSKLQESTVLIVGLGGLGSGVAQILCRMGIGCLILVDNDLIQEHNLSRQQLYTVNDIGSSKVLASKKHLNQINPDCKIVIHQTFADSSFFKDVSIPDIVVDCTDRHQSRRDIDEFCINNNIPWVHGGAIREQGVVCVFGSRFNLKSYDDIYVGKNSDEFCEGVIATTTGLVSSLQASLAIKVLLNQEIPKGLLRVNLDSWSFNEINISK